MKAFNESRAASFLAGSLLVAAKVPLVPILSTSILVCSPWTAAQHAASKAAKLQAGRSPRPPRQRGDSRSEIMAATPSARPFQGMGAGYASPTLQRWRCKSEANRGEMTHAWPTSRPGVAPSCAVSKRRLFPGVGRRGLHARTHGFHEARAKSPRGNALQVGQGQVLLVQELVVLRPRRGREDASVDHLLDLHLQSGSEILGQVVGQPVAGFRGLP